MCFPSVLVYRVRALRRDRRLVSRFPRFLVFEPKNLAGLVLRISQKREKRPGRAYVRKTLGFLKKPSGCNGEVRCQVYAVLTIRKSPAKRGAPANLERGIAMASTLSTRPLSVLANTAPYGAILDRTVRALVVTSQLELRQSLLHVLETLSMDVIVCSNLAQALEVLCAQEFDLVFCDDRLPDGAYSDLISNQPHTGRAHPVIVTTRTGDWELYMEALRKGAFDVIRYPGPVTDVELAVIRALREDRATSRAVA